MLVEKIDKKTIKANRKELRKNFIEELENIILQKATEIRENKETSVEEKLIKVDIILNTCRFLQNYDIYNDILRKGINEKER